MFFQNTPERENQRTLTIERRGQNPYLECASVDAVGTAPKSGDLVDEQHRLTAAQHNWAFPASPRGPRDRERRRSIGEASVQHRCSIDGPWSAHGFLLRQLLELREFPWWDMRPNAPRVREDLVERRKQRAVVQSAGVQRQRPRRGVATKNGRAAGWAKVTPRNAAVVQCMQISCKRTSERDVFAADANVRRERRARGFLTIDAMTEPGVEHGATKLVTQSATQTAADERRNLEFTHGQASIGEDGDADNYVFDVVLTLGRLLDVCDTRRVIPFVRPDRREALFGGSGFVLVESLSGQLCAPFTVALNCELSPHGEVGEHVQANEDELCIVLAGDGIMRVNGVSRPVRAGSVVGLPLGQRLAISNTADAPLRYLIVKAARK